MSIDTETTKVEEGPASDTAVWLCPLLEPGVTIDAPSYVADLASGTIPRR